MKKTIIALLLSVTSFAFAEDLAQLYEKAYFLETAKGQTEEAMALYKQIAVKEVTDENRETVIQALNRLQNIYVIQRLPTGTNEELFDKASRLRKLDHHDQAAGILEKLSVIPGDKVTPNTREHVFHSKILESLLEIATLKNDQKAIAIYQERLLKETDKTIHSLINKMPEGSTVYLPAGHYSGNKLAYHSNKNIWVDKDITIKGTDREQCIIEGTMDLPLIRANPGSKLTLDTLTLKSEILSYNKDQPLSELGCALKVGNNAEVTVTNCSVIAKGTLTRCPLAIFTEGFSKVDILDCQISGFAISAYFGDGSSGSIKQSIIQNGLMTNPDTNVQIVDTILHDSKFESISCGGGNLTVKSCLFVNQGGVLRVGSRTDKITMANSALINCERILTFYQNKVSHEGLVKLNNNVFLSNSFVSESDSPMQEGRVFTSTECTLQDNIFYGNTVENWTQTFFADRMDAGSNTFWSNEGLNSTTLEKQPDLGKILCIDPQFKDFRTGDFTVENETIKSAKHGLTNPSAISLLWKKYKELSK